MGVAQRLALEGNDVYMHVREPRAFRQGRGLLHRPQKWQGEVRNADLIIADCVGLGHLERAIADSNRPYLGFCQLLDAVELDRARGMEMFERAGITTPPTYPYGTVSEARGIPEQNG